MKKVQKTCDYCKKAFVLSLNRTALCRTTVKNRCPDTEKAQRKTKKAVLHWDGRYEQQYFKLLLFCLIDKLGWCHHQYAQVVETFLVTGNHYVWMIWK